MNRISWDDWINTQNAEKATRTAQTLQSLGEQYLELHGHLTPGQGGATPGVGSPAVSKMPVRGDTVDAIRDVERWVAQTAPVVWGTLRMGLYQPAGGRHAATVRGLRAIADNLGGVYAADRDLGWRISREGGRLAWRVGVVLGVEEPARRVDAPCPSCGMVSLWWKRTLGEVRCGMPDCAQVWDLAGESILRYQVGASRGSA